MSKIETSLRQKKVSEQLKRIVVSALVFDLLSDNPIKNMFTIDRAQISADLRNLTLYVGVKSKDDRVLDVIKALLDEQIHALKDIIAKNVVLKFIPNIKFFVDNSRREETSIITKTQIIPDDIL